MITQPDQGASKVRRLGRAPSQSSTGRICVDPGCSTELSIYNRRDTCFSHSPLRFPRTRGRPKSERPHLGTAPGGRDVAK